MKRFFQILIKPILWLGGAYYAACLWLARFSMRGQLSELEAKRARHERFKGVYKAFISRLDRSSLTTKAYHPMMVDIAYEEKLGSAVSRLQPIVYASCLAVREREAEIEWLVEELTDLLSKERPLDKIAAERLSRRAGEVHRYLDELELLLEAQTDPNP